MKLLKEYITKLVNETITEKWSKKYKDSINCNNPKGFSQRAHCQGKKKHLKEDDEFSNEITVYHGTKPKFVKDIVNNGLIDKTGYSPKNYMLSTDFESALFHADSDEGENVYVIEFEVPIEDTKWFGYPYLWKGENRNDNSTWFALKQPVPKEFIKKVHNIDYKDWIKQKNIGF
jgi:hypothetical protein